MKKIKKSSFVFTLIFGFILNSAVLLFAVQKTEVKKETVVQTKVESNKEKISTEKAAVQVKAEKEKAASQVKADKEKVVAEKAERATAEAKAKQDAVAQAEAEKQEIIKPFYVYSNIGSNLNHYIPSGYMGDTEDLKIKRISGNNSSSGNGGYLELTYTQKSDGGKGWAGVYWLEPVDNWGTSSGGYNLKGFNSLTFLAKGLTGNEVISEVKIGGIKGKYSDSTSGSLKNVRLTKDWQLYTMDLRGKKMSRIAGGFCVVFDKYNNPNGCTIYLNEIKYEIQK
ncbi:MAG: hypothetical protein LBT18_05955 [Endomicrobium sp.]|jgi:hypothetical protein|nr:hypothetical protein [Endomicrobium sp.]